MELEQLRYPIGKFIPQSSYTAAEVKTNIQIISALPSKFINLLGGWDEDKISTPYRPDGWTIRQLIHHVADSHINAYTRFRLALTEDNPTIKPYWEDRWAELVDSKMAIEFSLHILDGLHTRWTALLDSLTELELKREFKHPEHTALFKVDEYIGMYAWHSNHHLAHITELKKRKGW